MFISIEIGRVKVKLYKRFINYYIAILMEKFPISTNDEWCCDWCINIYHISRDKTYAKK